MKEIKKGKFAIYNGFEYTLTRDMGGHTLIITQDVKAIDDSFEDTYHSGVYSKVITLDDLESVYKIRTYGIIEDCEVAIVKIKDNECLVWTSEYDIAQKLNLKHVDRYEYEGWVSLDRVEIVEEKTIIK